MYSPAMDIEFHYYMTYLIAARAGFAPGEAVIVAQAAQEVDDNHLPMQVSAHTPSAYENAISQTMDILRPHHNRRIYPIFHFIPGDPDAPSARRKDDLRSDWVTTPNSALANEMLDTALRSGDLYRIGASAHSFADTWAHQNFLGKDDAYNEMPSESLAQHLQSSIALMRIGHALAGHLPDIPRLVWNDDRLAEPVIDNTARFMDAADHLYRKLAKFKNNAVTTEQIDQTSTSLLADLREDIGPSSRDAPPLDPVRIARYQKRALSKGYGGTAIPEYQEAKWADAAFIEQRSDLLPRIATFLAEHAGLAGDILEFGVRMPCTWKDPANARQTDWYRFQEAVKAHLEECWDVLIKRLPDIAR
jgi:hypothetical protein